MIVSFLAADYFRELYLFIWLDCNRRPKPKGIDEGIWRRIKLVEFKVQIPIGERDEHLGDKLTAEGSGILNWMLNGLRSWLADGRKLNEPREMREAVGAYRADSDTFGSFLSECLENNDAAKTAVAVVYSAYCSWADENGMTFRLTKIELGRRMAERGYQTIASNSTRYFKDCSIRQNTGGVADEDEVEVEDNRAF